MNIQEYHIIYWEIINFPTIPFTFIERLDQHYAEDLEKVLLENSNKNVLIVIMFDAFYPSIKEVMTYPYESFVRDLTCYVNHIINNNNKANSTNIFSKINDEWYSYCDITSIAQQSLLDEYCNASKNIYRNTVITSVPIVNPVTERNYIDTFIKRYQQRFPLKNIKSAILPSVAPFKYALTTEKLEKEFSLVYWSLEENNNLSIINAEEFYKKNLDNLYKYNFNLKKNKILLIFVFDGYCYFLSVIGENEGGLGIYENFIQHLQEYLESAINNKPLSGYNFFIDINNSWYNDPLGNLDLGDNANSIKIMTMKSRRLIDEYVAQLHMMYPDKTFRYIVLPRANPFKYVLL